jgi:hypothetical protein
VDRLPVGQGVNPHGHDAQCHEPILTLDALRIARHLPTTRSPVQREEPPKGVRNRLLAVALHANSIGELSLEVARAGSATYYGRRTKWLPLRTARVLTTGSPASTDEDCRAVRIQKSAARSFRFTQELLGPPEPHTVWWMTFVSSWISAVRSVFCFNDSDSFCSTVSICSSWALMRARVVSRLRSERFQDSQHDGSKVFVIQG